jgi:hypothetical protein
MRSGNIGGRSALGASLVACAALALPASSQAVANPVEPIPRVTTAAVSYVLSSSALLNAVIDPNSTPTSYYFQWGPAATFGPTAGYTSQTPTVSVGSGTAQVKVGQAVTGLQQGVAYHFRAVGIYGQGNLVYGRDQVFTAKQTPLLFELAKSFQAVVGTPFILSGALTGFGNAHKAVVLQASPYPYLEPFTNIGVPGVTDASGRFAFRVAHLSRSTQFRVSTLDLRPLYSPVTTVHAQVRVTLSVRSSGHPGLVRLFGTVSPAAVGAQVQFQVQKKVRPRPGEETATPTRYVTQFTTVARKGNRTFSRFSMVVTVRHGGRYRAFVKLPTTGPLASGWSAHTVVLHAAPVGTRRGK